MNGPMRRFFVLLMSSRSFQVGLEEWTGPWSNTLQEWTYEWLERLNHIFAQKNVSLE